jgi:hypothetical protein
MLTLLRLMEQQAAEDCTVRNFIIVTLHQILLGRVRWAGHVAWHFLRVHVVLYITPPPRKIILWSEVG